MKYIDSEKLIAEIERHQQNIDEISAKHGGKNSYRMGRQAEIDSIKSLITSLQQDQPGVDLEKEITRWLDKGDITDTRFDDYDDADIERTARHFYELGLNAIKEK